MAAASFPNILGKSKPWRRGETLRAPRRAEAAKVPGYCWPMLARRCSSHLLLGRQVAHSESWHLEGLRLDRTIQAQFQLLPNCQVAGVRELEDCTLLDVALVH